MVVPSDLDALAAPRRLFASGTTFLLFEDGGVPDRLATKTGSLDLAEIPRLSEEAEPLTGIDRDADTAAGRIYFARRGAVLGGVRRVLVPATEAEPFSTEAAVKASLSTEGFRVLAAYEPTPGKGLPITPRYEAAPGSGLPIVPRREMRRCLGPPPHEVEVFAAEPICPIHNRPVEPA